jgi:hypothetical protein
LRFRKSEEREREREKEEDYVYAVSYQSKVIELESPEEGKGG